MQSVACVMGISFVLTHLSRAGVAPRVAMAAIRHGSLELTMSIATDPTLMDVRSNPRRGYDIGPIICPFVGIGRADDGSPPESKRFAFVIDLLRWFSYHRQIT